MPLLRYLNQIASGLVDRSPWSYRWQAFKWKLRYLLNKGAYVPAFETLIKQPHRTLVRDAVLALDPRSVLDVGCGRGANLFLLSQARPDLQLIGTDVSEQAITSSRAELERHGIVNVRLEVADAMKLSAFSDNSIDVLLADAVLMYVPPRQIERTLGEMLRVCRRGLVLSTWQSKVAGAGICDEGMWIYDYGQLLGRLGNLRLETATYPDGAWSDVRWRRYGVIYTVRRDW